MENIQIESVSDPFDGAEVAREAVAALALAEAMGLLPPNQVIRRLDSAALDRAMQGVARAGIATGIIAALRSRPSDTTSLARLLRGIRGALEGSPIPAREWPAVEAVLGGELLGRLVSVSPASLHRYRGGGRPTPDDVAARLHFLAMSIAELHGSYNALGVRRWFARPRTALGGRCPADVLRGEWNPDDPGPRRVLELARSLSAAGAT